MCIINYTRCTYMPHTHISMTFEPTGDTCVLVSKHGTCFWEGWPCATKCEKDSKVRVEMVERK